MIFTITCFLAVLCFGVVSIGVAFLATALSGHILQATIAIVAAANGPLLGQFLLGGIFPMANWQVCNTLLYSADI